MHKRFLSYIESSALFTIDQRILVAVSGGMDSMTLSELLRINNFNFEIAHFNHVTRNGESDLDEKFVKAYALKYKIPFHSKRMDINKIIEKNGGNFQSLARVYRYEWLNDILVEDEFDYIATAHHHNDQIETFLFHFSRGTGLDGLTGIAAKHGKIIRPMLPFTRSEIESYVLENKVEYRVDSSNSSNKYSRNYIRHGIIPSFKILNEHFEQNANTSIENLRSAKNLYNYLIEKESKNIKLQKKQIIELKTRLIENSGSNKLQLCFELIRPYGFNYSQACQLMDSISQRGNIFYSDNYVLLVEKDKLIIKKRSEKLEISEWVSERCTIQGVGTLVIEPVKSSDDYRSTKNIEYIDGDKIELPLLLRNKKDGDRFKPLGMGGKTKKIKDFFTDLKLTKFEKEKKLVLVNKKRIVWVIGHRLSDYFKITDKTTKVFKLIWKAE